jgi:hypothetical protein
MGQIESEYEALGKSDHSQSQGWPGRPSMQAGQKKKHMKTCKARALELWGDHWQEWVVDFEGGRVGRESEGCTQGQIQEVEESKEKKNEGEHLSSQAAARRMGGV